MAAVGGPPPSGDNNRVHTVGAVSPRARVAQSDGGLLSTFYAFIQIIFRPIFALIGYFSRRAERKELVKALGENPEKIETLNKMDLRQLKAVQFLHSVGTLSKTDAIDAIDKCNYPNIVLNVIEKLNKHSGPLGLPDGLKADLMQKLLIDDNNDNNNQLTARLKEFAKALDAFIMGKGSFEAVANCLNGCQPPAAAIDFNSTIKPLLTQITQRRHTQNIQIFQQAFSATLENKEYQKESGPRLIRSPDAQLKGVSLEFQREKIAIGDREVRILVREPNGETRRITSSIPDSIEGEENIGLFLKNVDAHRIWEQEMEKAIKSVQTPHDLGVATTLSKLRNQIEAGTICVRSDGTLALTFRAPTIKNEATVISSEDVDNVEKLKVGESTDVSFYYRANFESIKGTVALTEKEHALEDEDPTTYLEFTSTATLPDGKTISYSSEIYDGQEKNVEQHLLLARAEVITQSE
ncbi:MAG: hypothetical protein S4CHLAM45_15110 [Chlamydiales bacterium]|nr:hypothetical protein [Chlamydiales bacterium]MCH9620128.1 hypothetical protein [Chlamydiales bacterium]MCH9623598.1 hypothetical protein [Chlamydiales bacterium]